MSKVIDKASKVWEYFKGKKRNIGIIAGFILRGVTIFFPNALPADQVNYIQTGIDVFLVGGLIDNLRRTTTVGNKVDASIKSSVSNFTNKLKNK
jgi:hypothetical protein